MLAGFLAELLQHRVDTGQLRRGGHREGGVVPADDLEILRDPKAHASRELDGTDTGGVGGAEDGVEGFLFVGFLQKLRHLVEAAVAMYGAECVLWESELRDALVQPGQLLCAGVADARVDIDELPCAGVIELVERVSHTALLVADGAVDVLALEITVQNHDRMLPGTLDDVGIVLRIRLDKL